MKWLWCQPELRNVDSSTVATSLPHPLPVAETKTLQQNKVLIPSEHKGLGGGGNPPSSIARPCSRLWTSRHTCFHSGEPPPFWSEHVEVSFPSFPQPEGCLSSLVSPVYADDLCRGWGWWKQKGKSTWMWTPVIDQVNGTVTINLGRGHVFFRDYRSCVDCPKAEGFTAKDI
jgi:hypothetical protein